MWKLDKKLKLLIGAATLWPLFYLLLFFIFIFGGIFLSQTQQEPPFFVNFMPVFMIFHFATIIGSLVLMVFYIIDDMKNPRISQEHRIYWVLGLFFGGMLVMPFYWYFNIWRDIPPHPDNVKNSPQKI